MTVRLRPFELGDECAALAAHEELAADHFAFLLDHDTAVPWARWVDRQAEIQRGVDLAPDRVRAAMLAAVVGDELVGRVSVRFELTEWLAAYGGHIGYAVRPSCRRRGYASAMLRAALEVARSAGLERVLITCDDGNVGSAAVIERCGGVLEGLIDGPDGGPPRRRYWIDLPPS
jgi:predicted acetyltransferase